jgi:hypothetical protein
MNIFNVYILKDCIVDKFDFWTSWSRMLLSNDTLMPISSLSDGLNDCAFVYDILFTSIGILWSNLQLLFRM